MLVLVSQLQDEQAKAGAAMQTIGKVTHCLKDNLSQAEQVKVATHGWNTSLAALRHSVENLQKRRLCNDLRPLREALDAAREAYGCDPSLEHEGDKDRCYQVIKTSTPARRV
jgi:hypothetical protein